MTLLAASVWEWGFLVFAGLFTLVMLFTLIAFVARLFRESRPNRRKR